VALTFIPPKAMSFWPVFGVYVGGSWGAAMPEQSGVLKF
jgi:hypothetical protein